MDSSWRIKKRHGSGASRLTMGFSRRISPIENLGLINGLRRFGRELPFRGAFTLLLIGALSLIVVSLFPPSTALDTELYVTYLEPRALLEETNPLVEEEPNATAPAHALLPTKVEPETPSRPVISKRARSPQIDRLDALRLPESEAVAAQPSRTVAGRPVPSRLEPSASAPPAVAAMGPAIGRSVGRRVASARGVNPPLPDRSALPSSPGGLGIEHPGRIGRQSVKAARAPMLASVGDARLRGVPLDSLASCVSIDREERLKQEVIAKVPEPSRCESAYGIYRFVETKNLNAFLMWIERSGDRRDGDRCVELSLALECLDGDASTKEIGES